MRQKIDYGIDLGTTNSAIARMDTGEATIIKSDAHQMDTTPSCVSFNKRKMVFVGFNSKNTVDEEAAVAFKKRRQAPSNSYFEFKRTMGRNHQYLSPLMERSYSSEELSAEVLKKLRGYITDETITAAIITVPAMFQQNQIDATQRAAEIAGFKYCELLQEPIAASIAYGIKTSNNNGYWLVFDFGGGTFDAALMHVDEGIMKVVDTAGDNHLGGKNLDEAIVDQLLIPEIAKNCDIEVLLKSQDLRLLQGALKKYAEQAKITLASKPSWNHFFEDFGDDDSGEEIQVDITISLGQFEEVCVPIFQKAIDICKQLLQRNKLNGSDLSSMILVGGPTFSQTLRRMIKEQITSRVDTSVDPMTAVAKGATLFASTKDIPIDLQKRDTSKAQLTLKYPETTVEINENLGVRIDRHKSTANLPDSFFIEVLRGDRGWSSGKLAMDGDAEIIDVELNEGKANSFDIKLFGADGSIIPCEPSSITIIHGLKIGKATLPYSLGLDVYDTTDGKQGVYAIKGLEKNNSLPAKGKWTYKTAKDIRPGNSADKFIMQFYEFDYGDDGSRAIYNTRIGCITISGDELPALLPAQSEVELTLSIDASRRCSVSIYIPSLDETLERKFQGDIQQPEVMEVLIEDVKEAREKIDTLASSENAEVVSLFVAELDEVENLLNNRGNDTDAKNQARDKLKKTFIALDKIEAENQWPEIAEKLDDSLENLVTTNQRYGNEKSRIVVDDVQKRARQIKSAQDFKGAKQLIDEIFGLSFALVQQDIGLWMSFIKDYDQDFDATEWTDKREARRVINEAKTMIATNPSKSKVEDAVRALWSLMPRDKREAAQKANNEILRR